MPDVRGWQRPGQNAVQVWVPEPRPGAAVPPFTSFLEGCRETRRTPPPTSRCILAGKPQGIASPEADSLMGESGQSWQPGPAPWLLGEASARTLQVPTHLDPISLLGAA